MWIFRGIVLLVGAIVLMSFFMANANKPIDFTFQIWPIVTKEYVVQVNFIMFVSFVCGMIVWAIGAWAREAQLLLRLSRSRRVIDGLEAEIADLRNIPIEDAAETGSIDENLPGKD